jgi:hypothetical protein
VSRDCVHGGDGDYCEELSGEGLRLDFARVFVGVDHFEEFTTPPPRSACGPAPAFDPSFWHQFSKTSRCFDAVLAYERKSGMCFDFIVRSRPDHEWKGPAMPAGALPWDRVTSSRARGTWKGVAQVEDHFMAVPRPLADIALRASSVWNGKCGHNLDEYRALCPIMGAAGTRTDAVWAVRVPSECLLGRYMHDHGLRWMDLTRGFNYQSRRVPARPNASQLGQYHLQRLGAPAAMWVNASGVLCAINAWFRHGRFVPGVALQRKRMYYAERHRNATNGLPLVEAPRQSLWEAEHTASDITARPRALTRTDRCWEAPNITKRRLIEHALNQ